MTRDGESEETNSGRALADRTRSKFQSACFFLLEKGVEKLACCVILYISKLASLENNGSHDSICFIRSAAHEGNEAPVEAEQRKLTERWDLLLQATELQYKLELLPTMIDARQRVNEEEPY